MKRKNEKRIYIGDIVITNKDFKPTFIDGTPANLDDRYLIGVVIFKKNEMYGVRFGSGIEFTNFLDGVLRQPVGYFLKREEFDLLSY